MPYDYPFAGIQMTDGEVADFLDRSGDRKTRTMQGGKGKGRVEKRDMIGR